MNGRSAGGLVLLLIGSMGLIGFLTGNLDRWLTFLFAPGGVAPAAAAGAASGSAPTGGGTVKLA